MSFFQNLFGSADADSEQEQASDGGGERQPDFERKRHLMVENQLRTRDITDTRVLEAMQNVPRHQFVPKSERERAYQDSALPIGHNQTISQPYMVASMTQALSLKSHHRVLEIGTGSGYQTAVLAELARKVYTIERIEALAKRASTTLEKLGYDNVHVRAGDGTLGWEDEAPFPRIIVTAGAPSIPESLCKQLTDDGFLVIPVGSRRKQQLQRIWKEEGEWRTENLASCVFVNLVGDEGW